MKKLSTPKVSDVSADVAPQLSLGQLPLDQLLAAEDSTAVISAIRSGIAVSAAEQERERLGIAAGTFARLLGYSERQWQRLRVNSADGNARLPAERGDRLLRLLRAFHEANEVFETPEATRAWFSQPNRAMAGETPLSLMDTHLGAEQVSEILGRIRYGIYS